MPFISYILLLTFKKFICFISCRQLAVKVSCDDCDYLFPYVFLSICVSFTLKICYLLYYIQNCHITIF